MSSLKVVAASGSALPGDLATEWMDAFGDTLYNLYGSTEVAWATIATPADMRAAPGTAGKPPRGTVLKLLDDKGVEVPQGETGRIFVANTMMFEGYTGGGSKDMVDGLMSTGDVGRMDDAGRLFVEGRDDEMIVSGGENLFPKEVEDTIARHKAVSEVAAVGVDDKDYGQRLRAFVVLESGQSADEDELKKHVEPSALLGRDLDVARREQEHLVGDPLHPAVHRVGEAGGEVDQALGEVGVGALEVQDHRDRFLELVRHVLGVVEGLGDHQVHADVAPVGAAARPRRLLRCRPTSTAWCAARTASRRRRCRRSRPGGGATAGAARSGVRGTGSPVLPRAHGDPAPLRTPRRQHRGPRRGRSRRACGARYR